ncbi:MAG TPA: HAD family phosphatase [Pirellulales bacterium]|nr:HAD family phosphatase [Pirellulales bacterium]
MTTSSERLGLIFDVDGVLVDSYGAHFKSWQQAAAEFGFSITEDEFAQNFGRKSHETIAERWGNRLTSQQVSSFEHRKEALYRDIIRRDFPAMNGAAELIDAWRAAGQLLAVASSGPPENVAIVLDQLGRRDKFQAVITGADVTRGKPDPQVFLLAAEGLRIAADRCAVIEDAPAGIAAAKAAGMVAFGLVSTGHTWESLSQADHRVASLRDLSPPQIAEAIG